jgi:hypothetical protein
VPRPATAPLGPRGGAARAQPHPPAATEPRPRAAAKRRQGRRGCRKGGAVRVFTLTVALIWSAAPGRLGWPPRLAGMGRTGYMPGWGIFNNYYFILFSAHLSTIL